MTTVSKKQAVPKIRTSLALMPNVHVAMIALKDYHDSQTEAAISANDIATQAIENMLDQAVEAGEIQPYREQGESMEIQEEGNVSEE